MGTIRVEVAHIVQAPAEDVYAVIADYHEGHPAILPKPYFQTMTVEQGGYGAGTVLRLTMEVFGQHFEYHPIVSEPEPGRVLVEKDQRSEQVTTFTFEPVAGGEKTRVTIRAQMPVSGGLQGLIQRLVQPRITAHIFKQELHLLDAYMRNRPSTNQPD